IEPAEHDTRSKVVPRPLSRKHLIPFPLMVVLMWISFPSCLRAQPVDPFSRLFGDAAGNKSKNYGRRRHLSRDDIGASPALKAGRTIVHFPATIEAHCLCLL